MATWSTYELRQIAEADDLHISPFREDGVTYGTTTWIWSVVVDDALYVRGYNGQRSAGTRQRSSRRQAESSPPARLKRSRSSPSTARSTTGSTRPTRQKTERARTSAR